MKKRTIILAIVLIVIILAVLFFTRRPVEPVPTPETEETVVPTVTEPTVKPTSQPTSEPTPEVTDTPELGSDEDVIIVIEDDQGVGGL